jgi:hypothetical protein
MVEIGMLGISRDDCHNSKICKNLKEWDIIEFVLELIKEAIDDPTIYVVWGSKSDDEWFLDIMERDLTETLNKF